MVLEIQRAFDFLLVSLGESCSKSELAELLRSSAWLVPIIIIYIYTYSPPVVTKRISLTAELELHDEV
jgi:hypothetical protein